MKFKCEKGELLNAVNALSRLATPRTTLPVLQNIYFEAGSDALTLRATDLEQTLEARVSAEIKETGKTTVPARMLAEYLQNNSDHSLTVSTDDTTFKVASPNHQASFKGMPAEEYPSLPQAKAEANLNFPAATLASAINKTVFAAALDDTRPVLGGLLWRFEPQNLELVATDGYRLSYTKLQYDGKLTGDYIIPRRSLQELSRLLAEGEVGITFGGTQVRFRTDRLELTSRILEGKFPDYAAILPKKKEVTVTVSSAALQQSLKLTSLFSRDSAYSTKITLEDNKLRLQATSVSLGENSNEITLDKPVGETFSVSANAQYLIEALSHVSGDVTLEFTDAKSPIVLRPTGASEYLYLVMPLRNE